MNYKLSRVPEPLDIFTFGAEVRLMVVKEYIPLSVFQIFEPVLRKMEGKNVANLSSEEKKLVQMIVALGNDYLYVEVLWGKFKTYMKTPQLEMAAKRYQQRGNSNAKATDEALQKKGREARRARFAELQKIAELCQHTSMSS